MLSERTKTSKFWKIIFTILHLICLIGPFLYFIPYAFITGAVISKIALGLSTVVSLILLIMSFIMDVTHRAGMHRGIMWTLIAGIMFCLESVKPFVWIMAVVSILDELVFCKLKDHFTTVYKTNKEIDKRF